MVRKLYRIKFTMLLALVLILNLVILAIPNTLLADNPTGTTLTISTIEGTVGNTVDVNVSVANPAEMSGGQFELQYDPAIADVVNAADIKRGALISDADAFIFTKNNKNTSNTLSVVWAAQGNPAPTITQDGIICTISFKLKAPGTANLDLQNIVLKDKNLNTITTTPVNGVINVTGSGTSGPILTVGNATGTVGNTVDVSISVANPSIISGGQFDLQYDPAIADVVNVTDIKRGELISNIDEFLLEKNNKKTANTLSVTWAGQGTPAPTITRDGIIFIITFKLNTVGTANLLLQNLVLKDKLNTIQVTSYPGSIIVTSEDTTNTALTASNISTSGFMVHLNPALNGLLLNNFSLVDGATQITISNVVTSDNGTTYTVTANLSAGKTYILNINKDGYNFGGGLNVSVPEPATSINGCINLETKAGGRNGGVSVSIKSTSTSVITASSGEFSIAGISGGTYTLVISAPGYLSREISNVTIQDGQTLNIAAPANPIPLWAGDFNGVNGVDPLDVALIIGKSGLSSGSMGYDPIADFNEVNGIDTLDVALVIGNSGRTSNDYPGWTW